MPAAKKFTSTPGPKNASRAAASARSSLTPHKITAANVARGFAAMNLMFVIFILLVLEIVGTPQILLTFGTRALVPILIFNVGGIVTVMLLLWVIKSYTEARWYGIGVGLPLQLCLAIFAYSMSKWFFLLTCLSLFVTAFGVVKQIGSRPEKTRIA
jgi:hypothetical protein